MLAIELKEKAGPSVQRLMAEGVIVFLAGATLIRLLPPHVLSNLFRIMDVVPGTQQEHSRARRGFSILDCVEFEGGSQMIERKIRIVEGFSWFGKNIGIKDETLDFGGILSDVPCQAAGVFTKNTMPGAPILVGREQLRNGLLQAIIVNSKNANVATQEKGIEDSKTICRLVAEACGLEADMVLPSSTGVIGRRLPMELIDKACKEVKQDFGKTDEHIEAFARSIMTTDTRPKWVSAKVGGATMLGIAKGSGMIEPNMATMLCYFVTDAKIASYQLQPMLGRVVDQSFNRISVDTDTSTSDTVVILSNGMAGQVNQDEFEVVFLEMAIYLAKEIARDGEGATKLIELIVSGAQTQEQALLTAKAVINSPLVKTAIYGADPNWGRFVMAIGKVFQYSVDLRDLRIIFGKGAHRLQIDAGTLDRHEVPLEEISDILKRDEVHIEVVLGKGSYSERIWGCDLTEEYVKINAYYTT
jgi:glutamate N-acetyltransferase/amino-acid N-acetyltransferase